MPFRPDFRKAVAAEPGERIGFAVILWPDKVTAEAAHEAIHEDEWLKAMTDLPFGGCRIVFGAFGPIPILRSD